MLANKPLAAADSNSVAGGKCVRSATLGNANGRLNAIDPPINRQIVPKKRNNNGKFNDDAFSTSSKTVAMTAVDD